LYQATTNINPKPINNHTIHSNQSSRWQLEVGGSARRQGSRARGQFQRLCSQARWQLELADPIAHSPGKDLGLELEHVAPNAKVSIREGELWEVHGEVGIQSLLFFFLFFVRTPRGG